MRGLTAVVVLVLAACTNTAAPAASNSPSPAPFVSPSEAHSEAASASAATSDTPRGELERTALNILTSDVAVGTFLNDVPFRVEDVLIDSDQLHLLVTFDDEMKDDQWPGESCDAAFATGPVTGAHFVVNVASHSVVAASPRWGDDSCIPKPDRE